LAEFVAKSMSKATSYQPIWVTGTDTGIGKTLFSAILTQGLKSSYWKPVQSGLDEGNTDTQMVEKLSGLSGSHFLKERWLLTEPLSPHLSAQIDGVSISLQDFGWPDSSQVQNDYLVMEGAGGLYVPLNEKNLLIELMIQLMAPVIVVCRSTLGTINHSLLTIDALKRHNLPVLGFVLSGEPNPENEKAVSRFSGVPVLGRVPVLKGEITSERLAKVWLDQHFESSILHALRKV